MIGVFLSAGAKDKKMWETLPSILCRLFPAVYAPRQRPVQAVPDPKLVICDLQSAGSVRCDHAVLIFKEISETALALPECRNMVAVVDSANAPLLEQVSATRLPAITCGFSARDTLTLSSIDTDSAVITLQRQLTCFDQSIAEPQEVPLRFSSPIDSFTLMAVSSVLILSGNIERIKQPFF